MPVEQSFITRYKAWIGTLLVLAALFVALLAVQRVQELRQKAASLTGIAQIVLTPATKDIESGTQATILLSATMPSVTVDAFQVVATITGTIANDLAFQPATPSAMKLAAQSMTSDGSQTTLKLAYITENPQVPFTGGIVTLGQVHFTAPTTGAMNITFDTSLSKILQNQTAADILLYPNTETYTFVGPTPTNTPTPTPANTPTPTPPSCTNQCGNTVCEEITCTAIGCPCAETPISCPIDCGGTTPTPTPTPTVIPSPTSIPIPFSLTVVGVPKTVTPGALVRFTVDIREPNKTHGTQAEGFNVQASIDDMQSQRSVVSVNGVYNTKLGIWTVQMKSPMTKKTYRVQVFGYCSADNAPCAKRYGIASQIIKTYSLTVGPNHPPILKQGSSWWGIQGQPVKFTIKGTDQDGDPLSLTITGLPRGLTYTCARANTLPSSIVCTIVGKAPTAGTYKITARLNDSFNPAVVATITFPIFRIPFVQ